MSCYTEKVSQGTNEIGNQPLSYNEHYVEYIHFYKSLCVIKKRQEPV